MKQDKPPLPAPTVPEAETVGLADLRKILGLPEPGRPAPVAPQRATVPRVRRRPWFALAFWALVVLFVFYVPVKRCPDCRGSGERPGRVIYRNFGFGRVPAGAAPNIRCGVCSGAGRLTTYQRLQDWIAEDEYGE